MTYKQIKLVNGDEFIANVLDVQEEEGVMIMSEALRIVEVENIEEGVSYFALRPLMSFTDEIDKLHVINTAHVSVETFPSDSILKYYKATIAKMKKIFELGKTMEDLEELDEEEYEKFMKTVDSDDEPIAGGNVLKFKPKGTLH